ncbi:KxYKxGKxW signal peptide domain-containing protein [Streptococcus dentasini]
MQRKTTYKLHKVKKHWVTIAGTVTAASIALLAQSGQVQADESAQVIPQAASDAIATKADTAQSQTEESVNTAVQTGESTPEAPSTEQAKEQEWVPVDRSQDTQAVPAEKSASTESTETPVVTQVPKDFPTVELPEGHLPEESPSATNSKGASDIPADKEQAETNSDQDNEAADDSAQATTTIQDSHVIVTEAGRATANQTHDGWVKDRNTGQTYYYRNGQKVTSSITEGNKTYYFDRDSGALLTKHWYLRHITSDFDAWLYLGEDGVAVTGYQTIEGKNYYFNEYGSQIKGMAEDTNGKPVMTDLNTGVISRVEFTPKTFYTPGSNNWYYVDENGALAKGWKTVNGQKLYFDSSGRQAKGEVVTTDGKLYYFDQDTGEMWTNRFVGYTHYRKTSAAPIYGVPQRVWYYLTEDGSAASGLVTVNGQTLFFRPNTHEQVKGEMVNTDQGLRYFDPETGDAWHDRTHVEIKGKYYDFDSEGIAHEVTG